MSGTADKMDKDAKEAEKSGKDESAAKETKEDDGNLYMQDVGFSVNIAVPGQEQFSIQARSSTLFSLVQSC